MNIITNYKNLYSWEEPLVVFDLETTGLSAIKDRIIEIGAIKIEKGRVTDSLSMLVNPGVDVPYHSTKVNGITTEMLQGQISDLEGVKLLLEMFKNSVIIAHNVTFDIGFINAYLTRENSPILDNILVDTVRLARKAFPGYKKYSLGIIAKELGIEVLNAHRAEDDARVCFELYKKSINKLNTFGE